MPKNKEENFIQSYDAQELIRADRLPDNFVRDSTRETIYDCTPEEYRNAKYTELVEDFSKHYREKSKQNRRLKNWFFIIIITLLVIVTIATIALSFIVLKEDNLIKSVSTIISSFVTLITSFLSLPKIIAKYLFPLKEDDALLDYLTNLRRTDCNPPEYPSNINYKNKKI
ncbi:MAG TPA: hypothetical protein VIL26_05885 [Clostridia bacterium]